LSVQRIARRYAVVLADVAIECGESHSVQEELVKWGSMIQSNPLLQEALSNPTIAYELKRNVLREIIARTKVRQTTGNFLQVLLKNQRLNELSEVNRKFGDVLDERSGAIAAYVTTAGPVPEEYKDTLLQKLTKLTGKKVRLTFAIDKEMIGGLVTRIGSTIYDGSVRDQLRRMERTLAGN
jgi:F-type H+-transporting ATPase subunit delta